MHGLQRAVIQQNSTGVKDLLVEGEGLREVMTTDGALGPLPPSFLLSRSQLMPSSPPPRLQVSSVT